VSSSAQKWLKYLLMRILVAPRQKRCQQGSRNYIPFQCTWLKPCYEHLIKHVGGVVMTKRMVNCLKISKSNLVYCKILIWRCAHYYHIPVHWVFLELCPKLCTCTSLDSNVQLCTFKHRNSPYTIISEIHMIILLYNNIRDSHDYTAIQ
jgi:hypothetical protein